jgi:hypothetical protein
VKGKFTLQSDSQRHRKIYLWRFGKASKQKREMRLEALNFLETKFE